MFWSKNRRKRAITNRQEKKSFKKKLIILFPFALIGAIVLIINSNLLKVSTIDLKVDHIDCASEQELKDNIGVIGLNIFSVDLNVVPQELLAKYKCIKKIEVGKQYPSTLKVLVSGRVPVLKVSTLYSQEATLSATLDEVLQQIASPSAEASVSATPTNFLTNDFLIDQEGEIFSAPSQEDLAKILLLTDEVIKVGQKLDKNLVDNLLVLFDKLKIFNVQYSQVKVYSQGNILVEGSTTILLNQKYDMQKQLASLQLILEKAKIENEQILFLDLRFEKPVVRYVKKGKKS